MLQVLEPQVADTQRAKLGQGDLAQPRITMQAAADACAKLIGFVPSRIEYPGGASRCSVRTVAGEQSFILTRRKHAARAVLEAGVLRELRAAGAPVPRVLAFDGEWLIQQDLGPRRLSAALGATNLRSAGNWAAEAASGLLLCQLAAGKTALEKRVAPIGVKPEWLASLLATPARVAAQLGLPDPDISNVITPEHITPRHLSFVKWDARPGNALLVNDGAADEGAAWIDWEHCGARDALDDLAWLLCDEYMPDHPGLEAALLKRFLPLFTVMSKRSPEDALLYLSRFGSLHTCMRLYLVLKHKGDGTWWSAEACERTDRIGVTVQAAQRLCARGARWAARWPGGERMHRFFANAGERLREPAADSFPTGTNAEPAHRNTPPRAVRSFDLLEKQ